MNGDQRRGISDNASVLLGFLGLFLAVVLITWSIVWYHEQKLEHRRPNVANVIITCLPSTNLDVDCEVRS